jgi:hypothetical protein
MMAVTEMKCVARLVMAIEQMSFNDGVFFSKQVGYVDHVDVRLWFNALNNHACNSGLSIVVVVDMLDVDRLCPTIIDALELARTNPNLLGIAMVTADSMTSRNALVLEELKKMPDVRLFSSVEKALNYAQSQLHPTIVPYSNSNMMTFVAGYNF